MTFQKRNIEPVNDRCMTLLLSGEKEGDCFFFEMGKPQPKRGTAKPCGGIFG
jgi:hypothetical protein